MPVLRDRHTERKALDQFVTNVRTGRSQALVVRGEAGVGKTALLGYLVDGAPGCRVERASGVQSEMELAFAGLHQLCAPMLDDAERLPHPQRDALYTVFGMNGGSRPDRLLVGLAVLGLLAEGAREQPLICVIDDAQWLDQASAQALNFVARRLVAESVGLVFAARDTDEVAELGGLVQLPIAGLPGDDARALLRSALPGPADDRILDRIVAETRGNPLALLELPRGMTPAELAVGFGLPGPQALPRRIEESYRHRLAPLPAATRELLLVAALDALGDPVLVLRAAEQLGIGLEAVRPAAEAGLLEIGARVRFHHPLVRSAVYGAALPEERRRAHQALAQVLNPDTDPNRRAWHAGQAASGPDEVIAAELERSAGRAQDCGGCAAAAAFLERAAELSVDRARRAQRMLAAAHATHQAGMPDAAERLLSLAQAYPLSELESAQVDLLHAQITLTNNRGGSAPSLLLKAAEQLTTLDARLARETYLDALMAAMLASSLASGDGVRETAEAARAAPPAPLPPRASDLLLDGLAIRFTDGYAAAMPMVKRALNAFRSPELSEEEAMRWLWLASRTSAHVWDYETLEALATRHVQLTRKAGALALLPFALSARIMAHVLAGELSAAASLTEELRSVTEATGSPRVRDPGLVLAAWQGLQAETLRQIDVMTEEVQRRGEGIGLTVVGWAKALLCNSLGQYDHALTAAKKAAEHPPVVGSAAWIVLIELIEASTRCSTPEPATDALHRLAETTRASGTDWGLGVEARSRALLSDGPAAESSYREAIDRLGRTAIRGELGRSHLVYGEWLRREHRRVDARVQLRTAHDIFTEMGAAGFAQRAARELRVTGETARKRTAETSSELTAQETQIVRLVRDGLTNAEIAARLFISPRTVAWHMQGIFGKLNVTSRRQLRL